MRYLTERAPIGVAFIFGVLATLGIGLQSNAFADEASAKATLKAMSDYLASQKSVSAKYNTELEVITPDIEKITFSSSGDILLSRPDRVRATRTGGYADIELFFDGKTFNVYGKHLNSFFRLDAPGTIDNLIDELREKHGAALPFADLLLSNPYKALIEGVLEAKDIGQGVIDGVECQHLAFRNEDVDWQLWVQLGANPIPRQYIITSKTLASAPQYRIRISDWKTDVAPANDAFAFKAPDGAKAVSAEAIRDFDELPVSAATARGK
jgi:hypothetical protein